MELQKVIDFIATALECSVYLSPLDPGLDYKEIAEVARREGFQPGETGDALRRATDNRQGSRYMPSQNTVTMWLMHVVVREPDFRDISALDFVYSQFKDLARSVGENRARLERGTIVERAVGDGVERIAIEAAITILLLTGLLVEKGGLLAFKQGYGTHPLPSEQRKHSTANLHHIDMRVRAYAAVKDVVSRRTNTLSLETEPLDAFAAALDGLGYGQFRMWWQQMVGELRRADAQFSPVSICVLSASLVEGALTFVVRHAQTLELGTLGSTTFKGDPRIWKIDDLVKSAAAGSDSSILSPADRSRAERLIQTRQRIHAGRMRSEHPGGVPDLRPEEARDAKATADIVVRAVLDWLQRYPASSARR